MLEIMGGKRLVINMIANIVAFVVQFGINFVLTPYIVRTLGNSPISGFRRILRMSRGVRLNSKKGVSLPLKRQEIF